MADTEKYSKISPINSFKLWEKLNKKNRSLHSLEFELTTRCNNNCTHCYINTAANNQSEKTKELTVEEIDKISDEAIKLEAFSVLLTGGEPLLRKDFSDLYLMLKKKGFIVSVFSNAVLINKNHIELFKKYPPRDIEISVYGVTKETYEKITRTPGSFNSFINGVNLLMNAGIRVRFKAMALKSNIHELEKISEFCRARTKDFFRFDPKLHLRYDLNDYRNAEIIRERLSPDEIAFIEQSDQERSNFLIENIDKYIYDKVERSKNNNLFLCGVGNGSLTIGADGYIRGCSSLSHPKMIYNWRKGSLKDAWENFFPDLIKYKTNNTKLIEKCRDCKITNLCMSCPANNYLESGNPDSFIEYFCEMAHARAAKLSLSINQIKNGVKL